MLPVIMPTSDHDDQPCVMLEAFGNLRHLLNCMIAVLPYCYLQR
jgi:hypothetical protein